MGSAPLPTPSLHEITRDHFRRLPVVHLAEMTASMRAARGEGAGIASRLCRCYLA